MAALSKTSKTKAGGTARKRGGAGTSPIKATKTTKVTTTHEGGLAETYKPKSELFMTAISTLAGEDTFYEKGEDRLERVRGLVHKVTKKDPEWVEQFAVWLRGPDANIRTLSLIIAAEYVKAGGPNGRRIVSGVCQRADEPAEILAYWAEKYGYPEGTDTFPLPSPKIPQAIRKGLSDAAQKLYNEYSVQKYNGASRDVRMANVLNLVHPKPRSAEQGQLFKYIIDSSIEDREVSTEGLPMIEASLKLRATPESKRRALLDDPEVFKAAGWTWEDISGWVPDGMDKAAWEAIIPNMGYMALLRNLRNFEAAGIGVKSRNYVRSYLTDPENVAKSRQFPYRFLSAYKNVGSSDYGSAIADALDLSVNNIVGFEGNTLILVDTSGSMGGGGYYGVSGRSSIAPVEIGALFGAALYKRSVQAGGNVNLVAYATTSQEVKPSKSTGVLQMIDTIRKKNTGYGTEHWKAVSKHYAGHDRVVIFTDVQAHDSPNATISKIPFIHTFDLGGYGRAPLGTGRKNGRFSYGGFTDSTFRLMNVLEKSDGQWPWESQD